VARDVLAGGERRRRHGGAAPQRSYRMGVVNARPAQAMRWGVHLKGETRDRIHAPQQADNLPQQLQYRVYARDRGTDETANAGLPQPVLTLADGRVLRGIAACAQLRTTQSLVGDQAALPLPREELQRLIDDSKKRVGPGGPATNPPTWLKSTEATSRFALYTGETSVKEGARRDSGSFYANQDNQYLRAFINRRYGEVFVMRAKAPTTPRAFAGGGSGATPASCATGRGARTRASARRASTPVSTTSRSRWTPTASTRS